MTAVLVPLSACSDFVITRPVAATAPPVQSLPPIGFNHRYGNSPLAAADGFALERTLFSLSEFWEVGVNTQPQAAGYVDRTNPAAVTAARARTTGVIVALATERLNTIHGMLAFPADSGQEQYCIAILGHLRSAGYTGLTSATVLVFFTEQDEHAVLTWSPATGYAFHVLDHDLAGNGLRPGPTSTPLPLPG